MGKGARVKWGIVLLLPVIALALNWPYLDSGFQADDYLFINALKEGVPFSRWRGFWSMDTPACFTSLWWLEDGLERGFFRPLPSLVFEGALGAFDDPAFVLHLWSILLHGLVSVALYLLVLKVTRKQGLAVLAAVIFVACEDHSMGVGWIAAMTDLMGAACVMLALLAHVHWLQARKPLALVSSLVMILLGLGCKESTAITPALLALLTLLLPDGRAARALHWSGLRPELRRLGRDWPSWAPALVVLLAFLVAYQALHLGGMNNLMYVSPFHSPARYLAHLLEHLPVMWLATISPARPALAMFFPAALRPMALVGVVAFALWMVALWPWRRDRFAVWALLAYFATLLPQMGTDASERGLYLPMIGASYLLALLLAQLPPVARRLRVEARQVPRLTRALGWWVLGGVVVLGTLLSVASPFVMARSLSEPERAMRAVVPLVEQRQPKHILVLNTSGILMTFYPGDLLAHLHGQRLDLRVLSSGQGVWSIERVGAKSFVLRTDRPGWLSNLFARFVRVSPQLEAQRVYANELFAATLLELTRDRTDVLAVQFDLRIPLEDPGLLVLRWDGERFVSLELADMPIRKPLVLADTSNPFGSMK